MKPISAQAIRVCGLTIPIARGTSKDHPDLKTAWGVYDWENEIIWIGAETPKDKIPFWEVHETLHALLNKSGALYVTAAALGISRDDPRMEAWEEAFVRVMTPHVLETFGGPRRISA